MTCGNVRVSFCLDLHACAQSKTKALPCSAGIAYSTLGGVGVVYCIGCFRFLIFSSDIKHTGKDHLACLA